MVRIMLPPMPAARPRGKAGQRAYYPKAYREWLDGATMLLRLQGYSMRIDDPDEKVQVIIRLEPCAFVVEIRSVGKVSLRSGMRGDIDNYTKAILDAVQAAGLIGNDRQVESLLVSFNGEPKEEG